MTESYGIAVIRTNPDAEDFDMNRLITLICTHIINSTKKSLSGYFFKKIARIRI